MCCPPSWLLDCTANAALTPAPHLDRQGVSLASITPGALVQAAHEVLQPAQPLSSPTAGKVPLAALTQAASCCAGLSAASRAAAGEGLRGPSPLSPLPGCPEGGPASSNRLGRAARAAAGARLWGCSPLCLMLRCPKGAPAAVLPVTPAADGMAPAWAAASRAVLPTWALRAALGCWAAALRGPMLVPGRCSPA